MLGVAQGLGIKHKEGGDWYSWWEQGWGVLGLEILLYGSHMFWSEFRLSPSIYNSTFPKLIGEGQGKKSIWLNCV